MEYFKRFGGDYLLFYLNDHLFFFPLTQTLHTLLSINFIILKQRTRSFKKSLLIRKHSHDQSPISWINILTLSNETSEAATTRNIELSNIHVFLPLTVRIISYNIKFVTTHLFDKYLTSLPL